MKRVSPLGEAIRILVITSVIACLVWSRDSLAQMSTEARRSATEVLNKYGTEDKFNQEAIKPLSTDAPMTSVNGATSFGSKVTCRESEDFLHVNMIPSGALDISELNVQLDLDFDGTRETANRIVGPFAGACINGMLSCDPGTSTNCRLAKWHADATGISLLPATAAEVGSCYCFNSACGSNLLWVNNEKVLTDISTGMARSLNAVQPRLTLAKVSLIDPVTMSYYGQLSACGTDGAPEVHFGSPATLVAAGTATAATPGTVANFMTGTPIMAEHGIRREARCALDRIVDYEDVTKDDILRISSMTRGSVTDCGPGCRQFMVGENVPGTYRGGGGSRCRLTNESLQWTVGRPDLLDSVQLLWTTYDDASRVYLDGTLIWSGYAGWVGPGVPSFRCDFKDHFVPLGIDVSSFFRTAGTVTALQELAHDSWGNSAFLFEARMREGCRVSGMRIDNGCASYEANPSCVLMNEVVDGVTTMNSFLRTGAVPPATDRAVGPTHCALTSGTQPWWHAERTYVCDTGARTHTTDGAAARRRADVVGNSFDATTGTFTDERNVSGAFLTSSETTHLPTAPWAPVACVPTCKTSKPRPGIEATTANPVNDINVTGVANDFSFKECDDTGACPLEPGETLVSACTCRSNFEQAATMSQLVRLIGQDTRCVVR